MKFLNLTNFLLSLSFLYFAEASSNVKVSELEKNFDEWASKYGKKYSSGEEKLKRMKIWSDNFDYISEQNSVGHTYKLGLNNFSDMTLEEFHQYYHIGEYSPGFEDDDDVEDEHTHLKGEMESVKSIRGLSKATNDFPDSVDWKDKGFVTAAKDQGDCGSCWAFSAVAVLESARAITHNINVTALSEQELVDCSTYNDGCGGGTPKKAFKEMQTENWAGLCSWSTYPYVAVYDGQQGCTLHKSTCTTVDHTSVVSYEKIKDFQPNILKFQVSNMPVSVGINSSSRAFQHYSEGILDSCGSDDAHENDHTIVVVGYDTERFFVLCMDNLCASAHWGEDGFMRIKMHVDGSGECGMYQVLFNARTD